MLTPVSVINTLIDHPNQAVEKSEEAEAKAKAEAETGFDALQTYQLTGINTGINTGLLLSVKTMKSGYINLNIPEQI